MIRTIIPARGRKLLKILRLRKLIGKKDKNHNPRKGTETSWVLHIYRFSVSWVKDKNHNPRKGTETSQALPLLYVLMQCDKNHNPRKGTETVMRLWRNGRRAVLIRTIIPARGRKQVLGRAHSFSFAMIRTIIPARGRKLRLHLYFLIKFMIRTIIPARGRKQPVHL